jgi:GTP-binding protein EngB required for normal cell division
MRMPDVTRHHTTLTRIAALAEAAAAEDTAREAEECAERAAAGRFFVTCLGQFKRGKSTLLNALVGREVLPIGVAPVTSVVTILRHGPAISALVRFADGRSDAIDLASLSEYVSESLNPGNTKQVAVVEVFIPSPLLASGLCLVDTPGIGSVSTAGSEIVHRFVPHVDAAIVAVGADPPITEEEVRLVEQVAKETHTLLFVLNKADKSPRADVEEARSFTERVLQDRLHLSVKVFLVSAAETLELHHETRQWALFEAALQALGSSRGSTDVRWRETRVADRLLRQLRADVAGQRHALLQPIAETEHRLRVLQQWLVDVDVELRELSYRLTGHHEALTPVFGEMRDRFLRAVSPSAIAELEQRMAVLPLDRHLRRSTMILTQEIAQARIEAWLDEIEPAAAKHYSDVTARFAALCNELLRRLADVEPGLADLPPLEADVAFRFNRGFYFTGLMRLTGGGFVPSLAAAAGSDWGRRQILSHASSICSGSWR